MFDPLEIIKEFYQPDTRLYRVLTGHGRQVAKKALEAADRVAHLNPDREIIREAAMLHDIGMIMTNAPRHGCMGNHPYICHGILGRAMLEKRGLARHAMVCERHVGVGLTIEDIRNQRLVLPLRDMVPITLEEKLICYADKFFSKTETEPPPHDLREILQELSRFGKDKAEKFMAWHEIFG